MMIFLCTYMMNDATDGQTNDSAPWPSEHTEAEDGQEWIMKLSREVIRRGIGDFTTGGSLSLHRGLPIPGLIR